MSRFWIASLCLGLVLFGNRTSTRGNEENTTGTPQVIKAVTSTASSTSTSSQKPEFKKIAPESTPVIGLLTFYRVKDKLYMEASSGDLNKDFIIVISIAKGIGLPPLMAGWSWDAGEDMVWQFRKVDDRIQIVRRNFRHQATAGTPEAKAIELAFTDSILYSLPIVAKGPNGGDIIDLTGIFMSDQIPMISQKAIPGFSFARDRSTWAKVKGLKDNMELEIAATYSGGGGSRAVLESNVMDTRGLSLNVHYSISRLVNEGYQPRLADERVGYFNTVIKNYSKNPEEKYFVRYINRWNLKKTEKGTDVSLAKKPIIFWLEKSIPYQYRKPIRDGILEWNKAYEKAGYFNAIEVRQQEDNDTWDPEDVNYNTIRWSATNLGFSIGPSRVNPLTGQILDADVILDVGFISSWEREFELYSPKELAVQLAGSLTPLAFFKDLRSEGSSAPEAYNLEHRPRSNFDTNEALFHSQQFGMALTFFDVMTAADLYYDPSYAAVNVDEKKELQKEKVKGASEKSSPKKQDTKEPAAEKTETAAKKSETGATNVKSAAPKDDKLTDAQKEAEKKKKETELQKKYDGERKKLIQQGLQWLVTHEVGHTLGLRHNFKLSTLLTLDELNDPAKTAEFGYAGSVMEYLPVNLMPKGKKQGDYYPTKLGKYDYWVIEYGYKDFGKGTETELPDLKKIAEQQSKPEYNYATDEDCGNITEDPMVNTFDLGKSPLEFAKMRAELAKEILKGLNNRIVKKGQSYSRLQTRFDMVLFDHAHAMYLATRYIGGMHINRDLKGDPGERPPFQLVDAKEQRAAFELLRKEVFGIDSYKIPMDLFNYLAPNRWRHWGSSINSQYDTDIHATIEMWHYYFLNALFEPSRLSRLNDAQLRAGQGQDTFTLFEMIESLTDSIFAELGKVEKEEGNFTLQNQAISSIRRNLQRLYVEYLTDTIAPANNVFFIINNGGGYSKSSDFSNLARVQLLDIKGRISRALDGKAKLDGLTKAHLLNLSNDIEQGLKAIRTRR